MPNTLKCLETGFIIPVSEKIFGISCPATAGVVPLCQSCVDKVPADVRRVGIGMNCEKGERGVDVYEARAEASASDCTQYDYATFVAGRIIFSLSESNAKKYLPVSFEKLPKPIPTKKSRVA